MHKLISSADQRNKAELVAIAELGKKAQKGLSAVVSSTLYQLPIPEGLESRTYGALYRFLSKTGVIPVGLYRGVFPQMKVEPKHNKMSYVYTNPPKDTELFSCDKVFVLSPIPPAQKAKETQRELQNAQEELVKSRLGLRGSMEATTAAMRDQFQVFGANQTIIVKHVDEMTAEIRTKLGRVMKRVNNLKDGGPDPMATSAAAADGSPKTPSVMQKPPEFARTRSGGNRPRAPAISRGDSMLKGTNGKSPLREGRTWSRGSNDEEGRPRQDSTHNLNEGSLKSPLMSSRSRAHAVNSFSGSEQNTPFTNARKGVQ